MVLETVGAIISRSIAIFTDVLHMASDLIGFIISLVALHYSNKKSNQKQSFGYVRAEVFGALLSLYIIWGMSIMVGYEAVSRIIMVIKGESL